jgi:hypothetical protein
MSANYYPISYFQRRKDISSISAEITLRKLSKLVRFSSVVDFGCGTGTWLTACQNAGVTKILGFDYYAKETELLIERKYFHKKSLAFKITLEEKYDLAISLEAAEHVEQIFADTIIENLTNASDVILFSAAIPGQGGTNHVNEQPPQYWAKKFANHGFAQFDIIRPLIWEENDVAWWYKQNTFLYINSDSNQRLKLDGMGHGLINQHVIHSQCLADKIEEFDIENASIKNLSKAIIKKLARKLSAPNL